MKKILFVCFFVTSIVATKAQDIIASTLKIGPFALDMKLQDVEAITLKKYTTETLRKSIEDYKPIAVQLNGVKFNLTFFEEYNEKSERSAKFKLYRVECDDTKVKTKSGIAYGMDYMQVLQLISKMDIGFSFSKYQEYDKDGKPTKKFNQSLSIYDSQAGKTLYIKFKDGKVSGFEAGYEEGC